ncbi:hypothetical protein J6590_036950 [Homalodisca vitripennis]|nr:hypothetical protein J6590_036950 [Homalodisca vitripennis]
MGLLTDWREIAHISNSMDMNPAFFISKSTACQAIDYVVDKHYHRWQSLSGQEIEVKTFAAKTAETVSTRRGRRNNCRSVAVYNRQYPALRWSVTMYFQIFLLVVAVSCVRAAEFNNEPARPSYPSPSTPLEPLYPHSSHPTSAEAKSYKEDDRRHYNDGPSHPRTYPPKKLGPGPGAGPVSFASHGLPPTYPHRFVPQGAVIGYLAYPQPLVQPLHDSLGPGLLPSAAFSHVALASPLALRPVPLGPSPGPSYSSAGPSYNSGGPGYSSAGPSYSSGPHSSYN